MIIRFLAVIALALTLTACTTTKDQQGDVGEQVTIEDYESISPDPLSGTEVYGGELGGLMPGTQQDLVVNVGDRVFFGYDRYDLTPEAQNVLSMQAQWMQQYPHVNVTIEGHADERGTREYNLALGERRATSVKNYLTAMGVDPRRITTISYGKERPAVHESNPSAWAQNRRGVTKVD
jgi:peptidoglycan-associated lipoprotein